MADTTTLAKRGPDPDIVMTTPAQFNETLARYTATHHVMTPFTNIGTIAPDHYIFANVIKIDPNHLHGEVYRGGKGEGCAPWLKEGQVALSKNGLRRLQGAFGLRTQIIPIDVTPEYWHVRAVATCTDIDGSTALREALYEWDLRDGSARIKGWTKNQIEEGRKHGYSNCQTRGVNRAIREFGVRQWYTPEELEKQFLVIRATYRPDVSDPAVKRAMLDHHMGATRALYSQAAALAPFDPLAEDDAPEPRYVGRGAGEPAAGTTQGQARTTGAQTTNGGAPAGTQAPKDKPPTEDAVQVKDVRKREGTSAPKDGKPGKPYTLYHVVDSNGVEYGTFSKTIADKADEYKIAGTWVEIQYETQGTRHNLIEIAPVKTEGMPAEGTY